MFASESAEAAAPPRSPGLELRLERGAASVALSPHALRPGLELEALAIALPDAGPPFDVAAGAKRYRHRLGDLDRLELRVTEAALEPLLARLDLARAGIEALSLSLRDGFAEGAGRLAGGVPFTFKAALLPEEGRRLAVLVYEPRLYAPAAIPAAALTRALAVASAPVAVTEGAALVADVLPPLLRSLLAARGFKLPRTHTARLSMAEITPAELRLGFGPSASLRRGPPEAPTSSRAAPSDPDFLAAVEGTRAFSEAERLLSGGDARAALDAYLALDSAAAAHPFAEGRLLSLLAWDERHHDDALRMAAAALERRSDCAPALLALATVRAARGDRAGSASALANVASIAARRGEEHSAMAAAEACFALGPDADPRAQACAAQAALSLRRDHLPALQALLALDEGAADREVVLHACRALISGAPSADEKAAAHARLGTLLLDSDVPAARLHLDHAQRLAPSSPAVLAAVARVSEATGEHLRAVRALDQTRDIALLQGDRAAAAAATLEVAALWERTGQLENALLRCGEACELTPSAEAHETAARFAEAVGQFAEAVSHQASALALLDPTAPDGAARLVRGRRALARLVEERLGDFSGAAVHHEAILELDPSDLQSLRALDRLYAALNRPAPRLALLDRLVACETDPAQRRRTLLAAARLEAPGKPEARRRWEAVLEGGAPEDPSFEREVLEGIALTAAAAGDLAAERDALARRAAIAAPGADRAAALDALAVAFDRSGEVGRALEAARDARREQDTLDRLQAELRIARASGDDARTGALLVEAAKTLPDPARASALLLEGASLLAGSEPGAALEAALEASRREPGSATALDAVAALAADLEPATAARALLARAQLARARGEDNVPSRLFAAGMAALDSGMDEGAGVLRLALAAGLEREEALAAWAALASRAAELMDAGEEREALIALVPLQPTGQKPASLLRLAALELDRGDAVAARNAAEKARTLAPRDVAALEACRAAAERMGDLAAVPDLLGALAALDPERAGSLLLEQARRLASLGRIDEADQTMVAALSKLPPDVTLSAEHASLRRSAPEPVHGRPWSDPLEEFARRAGLSAQAASALRDASRLAVRQGDRPAALRCARASFEHAQGDLALAGPLLLRLLYLAGSVEEALAVGRRLLAGGLPAPGEPGTSSACRALAELGEAAGDLDVARAALDRLLAERPYDIDAAARRFELDPDRARAVRELVEACAATRRVRLRSLALARAADAARRELGDFELSASLFARARADAGGHPAALARVEALRVEALRAAIDPFPAGAPTSLAEALRDLAAARLAAEDEGGAAQALEELAELEARHGRADDAARIRLDLEARARSRGEEDEAARHAREAGLLLASGAGEPEAAQAAEAALRRALPRRRSDVAAWRALEAAGRARGQDGLATVAEALVALADLTPGDHSLAREAAHTLAELGRGAESREILWRLVRADPEDAASAAALEAALAAEHHELAELHLLRASAASGPVRATRLREASRVLYAVGEAERARAAAREAFDAWPADDAAFSTALRDATEDVDRLAAVLAMRAEAVPADAAGCHRARADVLLAFGRQAEALTAYEACLEFDPEDVAALAHLAESRAVAEGDDAAAELDERLLAVAEREPDGISSPVQARSRARLALVAARGGLADEAARHLTRALDLAPGEERLPEAIAALADAGSVEAALSAARRLAESAGERDRIAALERAAALAERLEDRGQDAADVLESLAALRLTEGDGDDLAERAVGALLRSGENARAGALVALAARTARGARRAAWLVRLADAAAARGDQAAARAAREEALAADPSLAALREAHLADLESAGDPAALARALESALGAPGADRAVLSPRLARACTAAGDAVGAERAWREVIALGPEAACWEEAVREVSAMLAERGDTAGRAALALARAGATADPHDAARLYVEASILFERAGSFDDARGAAERASDADPDWDEPWAAIARAASAAGDREATARALLALAVRTDRAVVAAEATLGAARLLDEMGHTEDADRAYAAAVRRNPASPEARRALAERARARGDFAEVASQLSALDRDAMSAPERRDLDREIAQALSAAGAERAEGAWQALFDIDASDAEAFERLAAYARGRKDPHRWLELAARHEGALAGSEPERRRDIRCERAALLETMGQLSAAEGAWQAALALDPRHRPALRALRSHFERRGDHASAADVLASEAAVTDDPAAAAALLVEEARLRVTRVGDRARAREVLDAALERVKGRDDVAARRVREDARDIQDVWLSRPAAGEKETLRASTPKTRTHAGATAAANGSQAVNRPGTGPHAPQVQAFERAASAAAVQRLADGIRRAAESGAVDPERPDPKGRGGGSAAAAPSAHSLAVASGPPASPSSSSGAPPPRPPTATSTESPTARLEAALARARDADVSAFEEIAACARELAASSAVGDRIRRLGEAAAGIAAFAAGAEAAAEGGPRAVRVSESARASAALPLARGATAQLVSLLAPWLETLFPADLAGRGVSGEHRVGANRAPLLHALLEDVQRAIEARPFAAFLADRGGCAVAVENTQPPSIVLGSTLAGPLPPSVRRFLVARALSLCQLGWALLGKFAPRDIAILAELACRFAGAVPPSMGLPQGRAGPFLEALERSVPAPARERAAPIAAAAANELATLDPRELAREVRRTAARVALLHVGDVHAGLSALQAGDRRLVELPLGQALARPDLLDLALFAMSDDFTAWRAAAEGA